MKGFLTPQLKFYLPFIFVDGRNMESCPTKLVSCINVCSLPQCPTEEEIVKVKHSNIVKVKHSNIIHSNNILATRAVMVI